MYMYDRIHSGRSEFILFYIVLRDLNSVVFINSTIVSHNQVSRLMVVKCFVAPCNVLFCYFDILYLLSSVSSTSEDRNQ